MFALIFLFILVILISFFLALYSMHDFEIKPNSRSEYGTFLIRNPKNLTPHLLMSLFSDLAKSNLLISFEKLFKGHEVALVVYGPKNILMKYQDQFNFLELEDYTNSLDLDNVSIWEMGLKIPENFKDLIKLEKEEKLMFQLILHPRKGKDILNAQIRVVVSIADLERLKALKEALPKIPKPFSKIQLFEFYKKRSFISDIKNSNLKIGDILNLGLFF